MYKKKLIQTCCAAVLAIAPFGLLQAQSAWELQTAIGVFTFVPKVCGMYKEGDFYDIEAHGPGAAPDGEKAYMSFSSTADAIDVDLGVDSLRASSDRTVRSEGPLKVLVNDQKIKIVEIKLVDQDGKVVDMNATLEIDCS
ncbi:hypothetical protein H0A58_12210 [Alcaligenaceae bacterium]|nr:hypothetical protein [Alcaligenaceae bacterium]